MRDRVLDMYLTLPGRNEDEVQADKDTLLSSVESFLAFLRSRFPEESIIEPVERQAYKLLSDPVQMRKIIVDHFRAMWTKLLKAEWERIEPLIHKLVEAFKSIELGQYSDTEIGQLITGKSPGELEKLVELMGHAEQITFVPSVHNGPYLMQFFRDGVLWVLFGAHVPEGLRQGHAALSRAEFIVWLSALADDTRLQMLMLIKERGELCRAGNHRRARSEPIDRFPSSAPVGRIRFPTVRAESRRGNATPSILTDSRTLSVS